MKTKNFILLCMALLLFFIGNSCNYHDTVSSANAEFILPPDSGTIYQLTKRYFVAIPGDTALFYGSRQCTVTTNGIITSTTDDSAYLRTITLTGEYMEIDDTLHYVYRQLYQQSSTFADINKNTTIRFLEQTDSALLQVAYIENWKMHYTEKSRQVVMPRTVIVGLYGWYDTDSTSVPTNNKWPTSPLIRNPATSSNGNILFDGYSVASRVVALPKSGEPLYLINGVEYSNGICVKTYYSISGEIIENGMRVNILGSVQITRTYFTERGIIDQLIITYIQKIFSDGSIEITREKIYVARGPEGAKKYSENEYPW